MYQVFNMGHRLEVYTPSKAAAEAMIALSKSFNIDAQIIGHTEKCDDQQLVIENEFGRWEY
jgi:phosphoribosylformylglycinamidine cyclo-ligase